MVARNPSNPTTITGSFDQESAEELANQLRYGALPGMWRWGLAFLRNCTLERLDACHADELDNRSRRLEAANGVKVLSDVHREVVRGVGLFLGAQRELSRA
jgi:hypothetical protein